MKISLDDLITCPGGRLALAFKETIAGISAVKPVIGDLVVTLDSVGVRVCGRLATLLKLECHRCLKPYFQTLNITVDEQLVHVSPGQQMPRERELTSSDFVEPVPDDGILDITDIVYQSVTLASPGLCICGPECPGPQLGGSEVDQGAAAGRDASADPRWQNLKSLLPDKKRLSN